MIPREDEAGGPRLTSGTIALAVVLFLVLVATGAFLVWTFVEQKFCFGRKNAQDYSAVRLRGMQVRLCQCQDCAFVVCGNSYDASNFDFPHLSPFENCSHDD